MHPHNASPDMRQLASTLVLSLALSLAASATPAEDGGLLDGMKQRAEPLLYALGLLGSPYKMGGTDPRQGVDCSGFVRHVYKTTEDIDLPHSARDISRNGEPVERDQLQPGDLVFFNTLHRPYSHVGIYAGDGKFVHATSSRSKEVMVSNMNDRYWRTRYEGARRVRPGTSIR
jgi:cell wall-associated NlpC family hydrolase